MAVGGEGFLHDLPERLFRGAVRRTVIVGQIEMDDAVVEGIVGHFEGAGEGIDVTEVVPQAEGDFGNADAAASAATITNPAFIAVRSRGIDGIDHIG